MPPEDLKSDAEQQPTPAPDAGQPDDLTVLIAQITSDPEKAARHIKELRKESADKRAKAQQAEAEAARLAQEAEARKQAELAEQGKWQELATQREQELATVKAQAESLQRYRETVEAQVRQRLEALPEAHRKLIQSDDPLVTLERLRAAEDAGILNTNRPAPQVDAGAGRSLSDEEKAQAILASMKPKFRL